MSIFSEAFTTALFTYLNSRSTTKKLIDFFLIITLVTWVAVVYMVTTNYNSLLNVLHSSKVDVVAAIRLDQNINEELSHLMQETGSDRSALARFHNTIKDVQGNHFVYETRSNESLQPGVAPAVPIRQSVLISILGPWAQEFVHNKCVYMTGLKTTDALYEFYRQIGVKSDIKCPVFSIKGQLVGFIYCEFTTHTVSIDELKQLEDKLRNSSAKIGAVLSLASND